MLVKACAIVRIVNIELEDYVYGHALQIIVKGYHYIQRALFIK